jgi:hypothetical protein
MSRRASSASRYPDEASSPVQRAAAVFAADDWRLLIHLPAEAMIAAISAQIDRPRHTVTEGLAGLDAIAAGRYYDSDLVRAVVTAIYSEPDEDRAMLADPPDRPAERAQVLADCRRATRILHAAADPADAAAYRHWVQHVAVRVCQAARSGGVLALGAERITQAEQAFLDELGAALG